MRQIGFGGLPELIAFICFCHISAFGQYAQLGLYLFDKIFAADSNASGPFVIPAVAVSQKLSGPPLVISFGLVVVVGTQQFHDFFVIYQDILSSRPLDLIVSGVGPLRWMIDNTGAHHVQIDVGTATEK